MEHHAENAALEVPVRHVSSLDFEDAFSDTDVNDLSYQFSPDSIRDEIARTLPRDDAWSDAKPPVIIPEQPLVTGQTELIEPDSSVANSPDSSGLSSHFSQISLSTSDTAVDDEVDKLSTRDPSPDEIAESTYPNIVIDASADKSLSNRVSYTEAPSRNGKSIEEQTSTSHSVDHMPSTSLSTQSLPTPTSNSFRSIHPSPQNYTATPTPSASPAPSQPVANPSSVASSSTSQSEVQTSKPPHPHKLSRSTGPSAFEKVRSKTRPSFLPPKPRKEDDRHLADWQTMMKLSRVAADKRKKAAQERSLAREKQIEESIHIWEKEIVPDWRAVHKNPALKKLWWKGIPTNLRATMWERAVGNPLALGKDHYRSCLARAKRALSSGVFPKASLELVEEDISTTLPALHIFHNETGPLYPDLKDMLCAWVVSRSDEGLGYTLGAAKIAAMLLINMPAQQAFIVMRNLLERHCLRSFYGGDGSKDDVEAYYRIFDTLLADGMPKIYFNFKQHQISPAAYLPDWFLPLFLDHLPFEACARIWDVIVLEGDAFLYRAALAILAVLEPRLFFPDRRELLELLKGENKAALDVARREGRSLDGGKYEIYGVDEEALWDRIDSMEDWWKESTWTRLLQRELPDL